MLAQAGSQRVPETDVPIRTTARLVLAPAIIRDRSGEFVSGLRSEDFELTDNGAMQTLRVEQTKGQPVALVVVMQTGDGALREFQNYQTLTRLLKIADPETLQKVAFVTFDSKPRQVWNFPPLRDGVQYAMNHPESGDRGASILDAVGQALDLLRQQPAAMRKMILLLSQSRDDGSQISLSDLAQRLGEANVMVYSVTFPAAPGMASRSKRLGCNAGQLVLPKELARLCEDTALQLATLSGGEHIDVTKSAALDRSVSVLRDAFLNSYLLSFRPGSPDAGPHLLSLKIRTAGSPYAVSFRRFYWVR
ncbi:VWA domain-containing protein [Terriglobus albidus]|nr:VWA domain-containing protein [Terriglobus albidus]